MTSHFSIFIIAWIILAIGCGFAADRKGYSAAMAFAVSMIFGPLIPLIIVVLLPRRERVRSRGDGETLEDRNIRAVAETWRDTSGSRSGMS